MKLRIEGTLQELAAAEQQIRTLFRVISVSRPYRNRNSELYRIYIEMD